MKTQLNITLPSPNALSYSVWIGTQLLENSASWVPTNKSTLVIITDDTVKTHYAAALEQALVKGGYKTLLLSFPAGEQSKNSDTKSQLEKHLLEHQCDRESLLLALGGGVVGDLTGFIAATYMRGIDYIHIPTTLLAMVDSSIGGKTGINTPQGKNLIGAFWQPKAVIADINCLKSLPKEHFINGLFEAIKIFLTCDADALHYLDNHLEHILQHDQNTLMHIIQRAIQLKADIVQQDEKEQQQRVILNFGHTIGHALEHLCQYRLLHGYAVALGILVEAKIALLSGLLSDNDFHYIKSLLARLNITEQDLKQFDVKDIISSTQADKKKKAGAVNYVLLTEIGKVHIENNQFAHPVADSVIEEAFCQLNKGMTV